MDVFVKKIVSFFACLFVAVNIFAVPITAVGEGKTKKEAENDALLSLSKSIFSSVKGNTASFVTDENSVVNSYFEDSSSVETNVHLVGAVFGNYAKTGDTYTVTATIDENVAEQYKTEYFSILENLKQLIEVDNGTNAKERFEYYNQLYFLSSKARAYYFVYNYLTNNEYYVPSVDTVVNVYNIELNYNRAYDEYIAYLKRQITGAEFAADSDAKLAELKKELDEIQVHSEETQSKEASEQSYAEGENALALKERLKTFDESAFSTTPINRLSDADAIKKLSDGKVLFARNINNQIDLIKSEISQAESKRDKEVLEIKTRPYHPVDLVYNKPTAEALEEREKEAQERTDYYNRLIDAIPDKVLENSSNLTALLESAYLKPFDEFENTVYSSKAYKKDSTDRNEEIYVYAYNGEKHSWPASLSVNLVLGSDNVWFDFDIPYERLANAKVPARSNRTEFDKYKSTVSLYQNLLLDRTTSTSLISAEIETKYKEYCLNTFEAEVKVKFYVLDIETGKNVKIDEQVKTTRFDLPLSVYSSANIYEKSSDKYVALVYNDVCSRSRLYKTRYDRYLRNSKKTLAENEQKQREQEELARKERLEIEKLEKLKADEREAISKGKNTRVENQEPSSLPTINSFPYVAPMVVPKKKVNVNFFYSVGYEVGMDIASFISEDYDNVNMNIPFNLGVSIAGCIPLFLEAVPMIETRTVYLINGKKVTTANYLKTLLGLGIGYVFKTEKLDYTIACSFGLDETFSKWYISPKVEFDTIGTSARFGTYIGFRYHFYEKAPEVTIGLNLNGII